MFGRLAMGFANVRAGTRVLMLVLVQANYPETLSRAVICNSPWVVNVAWKAREPLPKHTAAPAPPAPTHRLSRPPPTSTASPTRQLAETITGKSIDSAFLRLTAEES